VEYLATHYTHFNAVRYARALNQLGLTASLIPVPRKISSSCGTCVRFVADDPRPLLALESERVFQISTDAAGQITYQLIQSNED